MSFRKTLKLVLIPLTLIPIVILGILSVYILTTNTDKLSRNALEGLSKTSGISMENYIKAQNREILLMSQQKRFRDCVIADAQNAHVQEIYSMSQEALQEWVDADPDYNAAYILNEQGVVIMCHDGLHVGDDLSYMPVFKSTIDKKNASVKTDISLTLDFEQEAIYQGCIIETAGTVGVIVLETSLTFYDKLVENITYGDTGASYIVDDHGVIICHSVPERRREVLTYENVGDVGTLVLDFKAGSIPQSGTMRYMYRDVERLMGYYVIDELGWAFVARQSMPEVNEPLNFILPVIITVFVIVLALSVIFCIMFIRTFTNPIQKLLAVFQKATINNEYILCEVEGNNEFSELAEGYNAMIAQLTIKDEELRENYLLLSAEQEKTAHLAEQLSANLEQQTTTLSTIFSYTPDVVFCKNLNSVYTVCNASFEKMAGRKASEIVGKSTIEVFNIDNKMAEEFLEADKKVFESKEPIVLEEVVTFPNGAKKVMDTIKTPLIQNNEVVGLMGISRDITRRKEIEEEARVASKAKSAFLAHMSHEIRTPLNAIIGMSGIAKNSIADQEKALASINQVISSSHHLLNILNDVLDMSKIESGKLELAAMPFNHSESCREVFGIISQRCSEKNIEFITNCDKIEHIANVTLIGDKLRLNQVLINLLSNAVKFTDNSGKIEFLLSVLEEDETNIHLQYSVSDNGIGMSDEQMAKLFTPFEQGDNSIASRFGGTGLGLSISQNIIKAMGGEIKVESTVNVGTRFYFDLCFEKKDVVIETPYEEQTSLVLKGKRILLVEDVRVNRVIVRELLSPTEVEIHEAENGRQGVEMFERSSVGYFDLIFMDVHMPVLDGYDATKEIRALQREDAEHIPIIAMTANAYKEDVEKSLDAGMNGHLTKPIEISAVMKVLRKYLQI